MVNANVKGREAENRVATLLTVRGYECELLRLQGIHDPGDLWVPNDDTRIEIKNHKNVLNAINEALRDVEKLNARFPDGRNLAIIARPGKPPQEWLVVQTVNDVFPIQPNSLAASATGVSV